MALLILEAVRVVAAAGLVVAVGMLTLITLPGVRDAH